LYAYSPQTSLPKTPLPRTSPSPKKKGKKKEKKGKKRKKKKKKNTKYKTDGKENGMTVEKTPVYITPILSQYNDSTVSNQEGKKNAE